MPRTNPCEDWEDIQPFIMQRERPQEINPADTLISDSQPPELFETEFLLLKSPSRCYFVMATLAN